MGSPRCLARQVHSEVLGAEGLAGWHVRPCPHVRSSIYGLAGRVSPRKSLAKQEVGEKRGEEEPEVREVPAELPTPAFAQQAPPEQPSGARES